MSTVCSCGKRRILGRGWVTEEGTGRVYCPDCWAREQESRRRMRERDQQQIAEGKEALASVRARLDSLRARLTPYAERHVELPTALVDPAAALADYAVRRLEWPYELLAKAGQGIQLKVLEDVRSTERNVVKETEQELQGILGTLGTLPAADTASAVRLLAEQCLRLQHVPFDYWSQPEFPVTTLVQMSAVDREPVYDLLLRTACDFQANQAARNLAIIALGEIGDSRAVEPLLNLVDRRAEITPLSGDPTISNACCALAVLGDERCVMPVLGAVCSHFCTGTWGHWQPRGFIAERFASLVVPGSPTYEQVRAMREEFSGSLEFAGLVIRQMLDQILGEPGD